MADKADKGVPALKNEDVTGMTEAKQEEVVHESGQAPRERAAKEFYEEQGEQAAGTERGDDKRPEKGR